MDTENSEINEGMIRFDIIFYVRMKDGLSQIIVNVEAQKAEPSSYDILNRAIFYVSRMISSQKGRDFVKSNYNDIKRVYSIWICMNTRENSLNKIALKNENVFGQSRWKDKYDMIHIVTIRLSRKMDEDRGHELHRFLGAIFAQELSFSEKEKILVKEFGIKLEGDRKERLTNMCNLGEGIWEQGIEQGKISGIIETCMKLNMSENDIIEKIKEIMHISGEEAKRYYKQAM